MSNPLTFQVAADDAGSRLDAFLARHLRLSRQQVRELLASGAVLLNRRVAGAAHKGRLLAAGDDLEVREFATAASAAIVPDPGAPLTLLASGPGWIAVDKPAGLPVHPLQPGERGTVLNAVVARYPQIQGVGEAGLRSGVVHRLDVETSGVLALALDQPTWQMLREEIRGSRGPRATKTYRAITAGQLHGEGHELLDLYVAQHHPARVRVAAPGRTQPSGTRRCDTTWRALQSFADATLLEVRIGTGFLHQIRATLAHLGHPLLGDTLYGGQPLAGAARLMLHASELHAGPLHARSPDPADFIAVLDRLA